MITLENPIRCVEKNELQHVISHVLETLTEREADFIVSKFWFQKTQRTIASENNISAARVHMVLGKALRKLSHESRSKLLKEVCI
jgi:RNA polymerase sigma factor (sigma-70 family)